MQDGGEELRKRLAKLYPAYVKLVSIPLQIKNLLVSCLLSITSTNSNNEYM